MKDIDEVKGMVENERNKRSVKKVKGMKVG